MPDISMCSNSTCPSKMLCYRYTATPNPYRQSYGLFSVTPEHSQCEYFTPNENPTIKGNKNVEA